MEQEKFAGLWIQHEPEYRIFVAFREYGEEILTNYLSSIYFADEIELKSAQYFLDQLHEDQELTSRMMQDTGLSLTSSLIMQLYQV